MSKINDGGIAYLLCEYSYASVRDVVARETYSRMQEDAGGELPHRETVEAAYTLADNYIAFCAPNYEPHVVLGATL